MRSILISTLVDSWTASQPQLVDAMSEADTPYLTYSIGRSPTTCAMMMKAMISQPGLNTGIIQVFDDLDDIPSSLKIEIIWKLPRLTKRSLHIEMKEETVRSHGSNCDHYFLASQKVLLLHRSLDIHSPGWTLPVQINNLQPRMYDLSHTG